MESSSDGSFLWTDASDDITDSENMAKSINNTNHSEEESESGRNYKKKLQEQLFLICKDNGISDADTRSPRKRKLSDQPSSGESVGKAKKKKIKIELESDVDKRKTKRQLSSSESNSHNLSNDSYDESYLDSKVKKEHFLIPSPSKTKKTHRISVASDSSMNNDDMLHKPLEIPVLVEKKDKAFFSSTDINIDYDSSKIEDSFLVEEDNANCMPKRKKKKKSKNNIDDNCSADMITDAALDGRPPPSILGSIENSKTQILKTTTNKLANGDIVTDDHVSLNNISNNTKRQSKISERLKFEDEDDSMLETKNPKNQLRKSSNEISFLKRFVGSQINVNIIARVESASLLTNDDDVWVIRCPTEVKVEMFQDKKIILDNKCKIKLNGQTYGGRFQEQKGNCTIVSAESNKSIIKNILTNGCTRLHRRIPKVHIQDDSVMVDSNPHSFIPLPETKCRHPLFGLHYKKAIKLPSSVKEKLQEPHIDTPIATQKKKKKRNKKLLEKKNEWQSENIDEPSAEPEELTPTTTKKKTKKKRRLGDAPGAWDSEKAIEQNLFDF